MAAKTITVALGDETFEVKKFNIEEHIKLGDIFEMPSRKIPKAVLILALESAVPPKTAVEVDSIQCGLDEMHGAVAAILAHSGYKPAEKSEAAAAA